MRTALRLTLLTAVGIGAFLLLAGCEGTGGHKMAAVSSGAEHEMMCKACYNEVKAVRRASPKEPWSRNQVIRKHHCADCKTDMTFYTEEGVPMVKCSKCAPEGVACDKCVPPKARP